MNLHEHVLNMHVESIYVNVTCMPVTEKILTKINFPSQLFNFESRVLTILYKLKKGISVGITLIDREPTTLPGSLEMVEIQNFQCQ